eukprot:56267_1
MRTANLVVYFIRRNEVEPETGIKQREIEKLVLKEKENEIEGAEELDNEQKLLEYIIHRLIETDHILLIKQYAPNKKDRVLIVHPNYDPDSKNLSNLTINEQQQATETEQNQQ